MSSRWQCCVSLETLPVTGEKFPQLWAPLSSLLSAHFSKTQWLYHFSGNDSSYFHNNIQDISVFFFHPIICSTSLKFGFQTWVWLDLRVEAPLIFHIFVVMKRFHRFFPHFQSYLALAPHTSTLSYWYIRSGFYTAFWAIWSVNRIIFITISTANDHSSLRVLFSNQTKTVASSQGNLIGLKDALCNIFMGCRQTKKQSLMQEIVVCRS